MSSAVGPRFFAYQDNWTPGGAPDVSLLKGYNVYAVCFFLHAKGPFDLALAWQQLSEPERVAMKSKYAAAGVKFIVSAFGSSERPTTDGVDPVAMANTMANWVIQYHMDGIDVDYEDTVAMDANNGKAEAWLIAFTKELRQRLPKGPYIVTHTPVAPWFSVKQYPNAYNTVNKNVGDLIDWYNVQFYNQGKDEYTTLDGLLFNSSSSCPKSSLFEIAEGGVPLNKLLIGKPATPADVTNGGYMTPDLLADCLKAAKDKNWSGGVMVWQYPHATADWIKTVRLKSWPV